MRTKALSRRSATPNRPAPGRRPASGAAGHDLEAAGTNQTGKLRSDADRTGKRWHLRLYVAGATPKSLTAFANLKQICETHLHGRYSIEVIDLVEQPGLSKGDQIIAIPTLVRKLPQPMRKIIGDLSDTARVLVGLDLRTALPPITPPAGRNGDTP